jgi:hypothetical protein
LHLPSTEANAQRFARCADIRLVTGLIAAIEQARNKKNGRKARSKTPQGARRRTTDICQFN